jgi:hypothetical protein
MVWHNWPITGFFKHVVIGSILAVRMEECLLGEVNPLDRSLYLEQLVSSLWLGIHWTTKKRYLCNKTQRRVKKEPNKLRLF